MGYWNVFNGSKQVARVPADSKWSAMAEARKQGLTVTDARKVKFKINKTFKIKLK